MHTNLWLWIGRNPLIRLVRKLLPVSDTYHGARFTVLRDGRRLLTPLAMVLIMVEATDVLFAIDSIPAIFGLRSLYFLFAGVVHKFLYLKPALAVILSFIGAKMLLVDLCHIPTAASLTIIGLVLLAAIVLSLLTDRRRQAAGRSAPKTDHDSLPVTNLR
jgi:tellurite resistance protein TerC